MNGHRYSRHWLLALIALGSAISIWNGWVQLGSVTGFGWMHPLPGIIPGLRMNAVITLPVSVEAYGAYALGVWLAPREVPERARSFARWSAIGALALGWTGQAASHVLTAAHVTVAPWPVTVIVASVPVAAFGLAVALTHLLRVIAPEPVRDVSETDISPSVAPAPEVRPVSAPELLPGAHLNGNGDHPVAAPAPAPAITGPQAGRTASRRSPRAPDPLAVFAPELTSGALPSLREIRRRVKCGEPRAKAIRAHLEDAVRGSGA